MAAKCTKLTVSTSSSEPQKKHGRKKIDRKASAAPPAAGPPTDQISEPTSSFDDKRRDPGEVINSSSVEPNESDSLRGDRQPAENDSQQAKSMKMPDTLKPKRKVTRTYTYRDEFGHPVYRVQRFEPKDFRPSHIDEFGRWHAGLNGTRRLPYGANRLVRLKGKVIYLCEGEKDTETAWKLGLDATCCSGGANGWRPEFATFFDGNYVVILPHNDDAGRDFANRALGDLSRHAIDAVILPLPGLKEKGDLTDFVDAGGGKDDVLRLSHDAFRDARPPSTNLDADDPAVTVSPQPAERNGKKPLWKLVRRKLSEIMPENIEWLWPDMWISGGLNLLTGNPGLGKSFIVADIAARVSRGFPWPDGSGNAPLGTVILMAKEDDYASVIVHRVAAAGGDLTKVECWPCKIQENEDGSTTEAEITLEDIDYMAHDLESVPDLKCVIFDPITEYLGSADANDNAEVRRVFGGLLKLAQEKDFAVICVTHDKKMNVAAINSPMGSTAFAALPRCVHGLYRDMKADGDMKRVLSPIKNNYGLDRKSRTFEICIDPGNRNKTHIVWGDRLDDRSADEVRAESLKFLAGYSREEGEDQTRKKREVAILTELDKLAILPEMYVPWASIKDRLTMSNGIFKAVVLGLESDGIVEHTDTDKPLPNGGFQPGGQKAMRRKRRDAIEGSK